jgi:uncharacterized protein (TIGR02588 family)
MSTSSKSKGNEKQPPGAEIPALEWIVGSLGLVIVVLAVGVLLYEAFAGDKSPPDVKLTVQTTTQLRNGYLVKVRAENQGGEPAARVRITAELMGKKQVLESRETQFEYLPPHSTREAGVFFSTDPREGEVRLQAQGYEEP